MEGFGVDLLVPQIRPYIHTMNAIGQILLTKLQPLNQSEIELADFTSNLPETTKALQLLDYSADVSEIIMLSSTNVKVHNATSPPHSFLYVHHFHSSVFLYTNAISDRKSVV